MGKQLCCFKALLLNQVVAGLMTAVFLAKRLSFDVPRETGNNFWVIMLVSMALTRDFAQICLQNRKNWEICRVIGRKLEIVTHFEAVRHIFG